MAPAQCGMAALVVSRSGDGRGRRRHLKTGIGLARMALAA